MTKTERKSVRTKDVFFPCTRDSLSALTALFDFVWPTAVAIWNLRQQVEKYLSSRPDASQDQLLDTFVAGSGIHGANLREACTVDSWESQQERLAEFLLISALSVYESWTSELCETLECRKKSKLLQFPTEIQHNKKQGYGKFEDEVLAAGSELMRESWMPILHTHKKFYPHHVEVYLACFRYFQELRNSTVHHDQVAHDRLVTRYAAFRDIADAASLDVKEIPTHIAVTEAGQSVTLNLRGVVGFTDILARLMVTIDILSSQSVAAETWVVKQWRSTHSHRFDVSTHNQRKRSYKLKTLACRLGIPRPKFVHQLDQRLTIEGLLPAAQFAN